MALRIQRATNALQPYNAVDLVRTDNSTIIHVHKQEEIAAIADL